MSKGPFQELFKDGQGEVWKLSENAPQVLIDAIKRGEEKLADVEEDITIEPVGDCEGHPRNYGDKLAIINVEQGTLFFIVEENEFQLFSVGVSTNGPLEGKQVSDALEQFTEGMEYTPEELTSSYEKATSLRSIRQSFEFVTANGASLQDSIDNLKGLLVNAEENRDQVYKEAKTVETQLHNFLSSVYTFEQTVDSSLKTLGLAREMKHHLQKYEDSVSTATGLRHCIQHRTALRIQWIAQYSHEIAGYDFLVGIPLSQVHREEIYNDTIYHDASGESYTPLEYFYGDLKERTISINRLTTEVLDATENTYKNLKSEMRDDPEIDPDRAKSWHILSSFDFSNGSENTSLRRS